MDEAPFAVPCGLRREHGHVPGPACHCLAPVPGYDIPGDEAHATHALAPQGMTYPPLFKRGFPPGGQASQTDPASDPLDANYRRALLGWLKLSVGRRLKVADGGARQGRLLYRAAVSALAPELFDQPLRRSFHTGGQPANSLMEAGFRIIWLQPNVSGFRLVLARGWHGARLSMRTVGRPYQATRHTASTEFSGA